MLNTKTICPKCHRRTYSEQVDWCPKCGYREGIYDLKLKVEKLEDKEVKKIN